MAKNLDKLTTIIDELEVQTNDMKEFTDVLNKISTLTSSSELLNKEIVKNAMSHLAITKKLEESTITLKDISNQIPDELKIRFIEQSKSNNNNYKAIELLIDTRLEKLSNEIIAQNTNKLNQLEDTLNSLQSSVEGIIESLKPKKKKWFFF